MNLRWISMICLLGVLLAAGCRKSTTVSGRVMYDGQPLKNGNILFSPADGHGSTCSGPISDGQYTVEALPGSKTVHITGLKTLKYNMNNPAEAALAEAASKRGDTSGVYKIADPSLTQAMGNHSTAEIKPGSQSIDFDLKSRDKAAKP